MSKTVLKRSEVDQSLTWDLTALFKTEDKFNERLKEIEVLGKELTAYQGKLNTAESIVAALKSYSSLSEKIVQAMTYASLNLSEDQTNPEANMRMMRAGALVSKVRSELSFIDSELSQADSKVLEAAVQLDGELETYMEDILRFKPYLLSDETEKILAALSPVLEAPYSIYNQAKLADLKFESFEAKGQSHPMSFGLFEGEWEYEKDTDIRRKAFDVFSEKLKTIENTVATAYVTQIKKEKILADARGFDSVIDYLLFDQKVSKELYDRQIDGIMEHLAPAMRKFAKLLKKIHGLDKMTFADLKLDVDADFEPKVSIEEAQKTVIDGLACMGNDYKIMLERAFSERWIDYVQNAGKSTGAFCSSPYGSHPYILISWTERMRECFVLAHELGHAGHFYLANANQSIFNTRPSMYFIEAPSTLNELLVAQQLLAKSEDKRMRRWVLSSMISRTYYHNFVTHLLEAHYQREVYRHLEKGEALVGRSLNQIKRATLEQFWGDTVEINAGAELTWMRQPHYYMGLYPYTYSAGLTVSTQVAQSIQRGEDLVPQWIEVLKAGGTKGPQELAMMAGVDLSTEVPLRSTIQFISDIIDEIESLTEELEKHNG